MTDDSLIEKLKAEYIVDPLRAGSNRFNEGIDVAISIVRQHEPATDINVGHKTSEISLGFEEMRDIFFDAYYGGDEGIIPPGMMERIKRALKAIEPYIRTTEPVLSYAGEASPRKDEAENDARVSSFHTALSSNSTSPAPSEQPVGVMVDGLSFTQDDVDNLVSIYNFIKVRDDLLESLFRAIKVCKERLSAPKRESGWQPIETAPKDGTAVLLYRNNEGWPKIRAGAYNERFKIWHCDYPHDDPPTHWMPLPNPPTQKASSHD